MSTTLDPLGPSPAHSGAQACVTLTNRTGFLCHDRRNCISASRVCDGVRTCPHGEDEDEALCREYLLSPAPAPKGPSRVPWLLPPDSSYPCGQTDAQPPLKLLGTSCPQAFVYMVPSSRNACPHPHTHIHAHTRERLHSVHSMSREPVFKFRGRVTREPSLTPK